MSHLSKRRLPSVRMNDYDHSSVVKYLTDIQAEEANAGFGVCQVEQGINTIEYMGGTYSPTQDRIYLAPGAAAGTSPQWHYIECSTGKVIPYTHGATVTAAGGTVYSTGVYSPTQDRIYFAPVSQADQAQWHYINCRTGEVVSYTHGATAVNSAYSGGIYSPKQNRIYFVPFSQLSQPQWHYIDCDTGNVVAYTHGITGLSVYDYFGASYSPVDNRIYLTPLLILQASNVMHYIDCNTGTVEEYPVTINHRPLGASGYMGSVYCPINNIILFIPENYDYSLLTHWHYLDLNTMDLVEYERPFNTGTNFRGGVYSPVSNKVYFTISALDITDNSLRYFDCTTMSFGSYDLSSISVSSGWGGSFSPRNNRVYFSPFAQLISGTTTYHVQEYSSKTVSTALMSSTLFSKT